MVSSVSVMEDHLNTIASHENKVYLKYLVWQVANGHFSLMTATAYLALVLVGFLEHFNSSPTAAALLSL